MREETKEEAARVAGISNATMYRYLANPEFKAAYRAARRQTFDEASYALEKGAHKAAQRLVDEIDDATASTGRRNQVFINRAKAILDLAFKARSAVAIEEELADLRALMDELKAPAPVNEISGGPSAKALRIAED